MLLDIKIIEINTPQDSNAIIGMAHFIKTVEDIYESLVNSVPNLKFGLAFCEASGERLVRIEGNDDHLKNAAACNMLKIGCGHSFLIFLQGAYPINVLNDLKRVPEICTIYAASANKLEVVVADTEKGSGILGVIDGFKPLGIENKEESDLRKNLLRKIGYKR